MRGFVIRLELVRIRQCSHCGRGGAELRGENGSILVVPLDPSRARELSGARTIDDLRSLTDLLLEHLDAAGALPREIVLDLADGTLRALLSFEHAGEVDVVACTADEGVALAMRGDLSLYATDEAVAQAATVQPDRHGGHGPETLH
jgi:hypothetical protein